MKWRAENRSGALPAGNKRVGRPARRLTALAGGHVAWVPFKKSPKADPPAVQDKIALENAFPVHGRYPHRLRAVGHLFEAEDESQAWPDLHDAIRKARRAYQRARKIPDFDALAAFVALHQHAG